MIELFGVTFLRPWWLAAVPLILILSVIFARRITALAGWDRAIDPALFAALKRLGRVIPGRGRKSWFPALAATIIALALVGPALRTNDGTSFRNLDGLVIVMDLSRSVAEGGRLAEARLAARYVADRAGSRAVALVVYAGDAYLANTFTTDAAALGTTIAALDGETIPDPGSRPERGLAIARQTLANANIIAGDVVLITDGGGIGSPALRETEAIAASGSRVSTLFVPAGGANGAQPEMPRPQHSVVDAVARIGGGVAGDVIFPASVADDAGAGRATNLAAGNLAALVWTDYGRYLLLFALPPALALFRRRA
jgi:Ca-activated chloride channel family protein